MKCQILFSRKNKKNVISLSFNEFAHSTVQDQVNYMHIHRGITKYLQTIGISSKSHTRGPV